MIRLLDDAATIASLQNNIDWLYAEAIGIFLILFILMFVLNFRNWKFRPINFLSTMYVFVMINAVSDIIWKFIDGNPNLAVLNRIIELIYTILFPIIGLLWLAHCLENDKASRTTKRWFLSICSLPVIFVAFMAIMSLKEGYIFYVGDDGVYRRGDFYFLTVAICFLELIVSAISELVAAFKANLLIERRKHLVAASFCVPVFIFALVQNILPAGVIPTTYFGILFAVIFTYIQSIREQITRDPTTNINNAYTIDRILEESIRKQEKGGTDNLLWLIVADLNDFKSINDTYGHVVGDKALGIVGEALLKVTYNLRANVGRIGGDEFFIIIESKDSVVPRTVVTALPKMLKELSANEDFDLSISLGVCLWEKGMNRKAFVERADERMYALKRSYHKQGIK